MSLLISTRSGIIVYSPDGGAIQKTYEHTLPIHLIKVTLESAIASYSLNCLNRC